MAVFGAVVLAVALNPVIPLIPKSGPQHAPRTEHAAQRLKGRTVECTSLRPGLAQTLVRHMVKSLERRSSRVSIALYDRNSHTSCTYRADVHYDSASTVKPIVLGALLLARGSGLTVEERSLAREMIVNSDNDATYALWDLLGAERIQDFLDRAGLEDTSLNEAGFMGLTQITAREQVKLLQLLTGADGSVLGTTERSYVLRLMREVQDDQRWGTPSGAPPDAVVQVKNGWLQRSEKGVRSSWDRGDWKVHSMSAITGRSYDYGLVVMTENNRVPEGASPEVGCDYGMETIERVARAVHRDLHPTEANEVHPA
ncbi:serine hydrolase [Streptomyces spongiicola]|nr:serine hydrolase [Streptomyces spongiicola]